MVNLGQRKGRPGYVYSLGRPIIARLNPGDGFTVRISDNARRSVLFFGSPTESGTEYGGTGFLVLHKYEEIACCYLVTARHVAQRVGIGTEVILRVNKKDGTSEPFELHDVVWHYPDDKRIDVAATPCYLNPADWDVAYLSLNDMVDRHAGDQPFRVQCGDSISMAGLFRLHSGTSKNIPIVHTGNIALLPDTKERIPVRDRISKERLEMEAYLVEAQTLEGLSGAPVFHREYVSLSMFPQHNGGPVIAMTGVQLLGIYSGAWDGEPGPVLAEDKKLKPNLRVPVGMGIVTPCDFLLDLIMTNKELIKHRAEQKKLRQQSTEAVIDSLLAADPPANGENPTHREDFTRLVDAAARKPAQEG